MCLKYTTAKQPTEVHWALNYYKIVYTKPGYYTVIINR